MGPHNAGQVPPSLMSQEPDGPPRPAGTSLLWKPSLQGVYRISRTGSQGPCGSRGLYGVLQSCRLTSSCFRTLAMLGVQWPSEYPSSTTPPALQGLATLVMVWSEAWYAVAYRQLKTNFPSTEFQCWVSSAAHQRIGDVGFQPVFSSFGARATKAPAPQTLHTMQAAPPLALNPRD